MLATTTTTTTTTTTWPPTTTNNNNTHRWLPHPEAGQPVEHPARILPGVGEVLIVPDSDRGWVALARCQHPADLLDEVSPWVEVLALFVIGVVAMFAHHDHPVDGDVIAPCQPHAPYY